MISDLNNERIIYTVEDHLRSTGDVPEWVVTLGCQLQEVLQCDAAIAASRARDLSSNALIARGLEKMVSGWIEIRESQYKGLNSWQRSTMLMLMEGLNEQIKKDLTAQ